MFMKKTTLLSLATAVAVVATSAGTYAAWDSIEATTSSTAVTFRKPVTVAVQNDLTMNEKEVKLNTLPSATGTVTFKIENEDNLADTLTITPNITGSGVTSADFDVVITGNDIASTDSNATFVDSRITSSTTERTYTVTVTAKESAKEKELNDVQIELTGVLSKSE